MMPPDDISAALSEALRDVALPSGAQARLAKHWDLLTQWNARINLTAVTDPHAAAWLHYRDSLAALPCLDAGPIVDFGSGAGFPGIPLAIARPHWDFSLVEPRRKRASFLAMAIARLQLTNVKVLTARMQDSADRAYAHAVTRATFSDVSEMTAAASWLRSGGTLLAYRAHPSAVSSEVYDYSVLGQRRCIEIMRFASL